EEVSERLNQISILVLRAFARPGRARQRPCSAADEEAATLESGRTIHTASERLSPRIACLSQGAKNFLDAPIIDLQPSARREPQERPPSALGVHLRQPRLGPRLRGQSQSRMAKQSRTVSRTARQLRLK